MAKVKLNPIVEELSGQLGDLVFREVNGQTILARKPAASSNEISENQAEHRERFRQAVAYGRSVMADPDMREIYSQAAGRKNMPVFALTVADFFNTPTIQQVDSSLYDGNVDGTIKIRALDDMGVANVHVTITNTQGNEAIEHGAALETAPGSGLWVYTAKTAVPAGTTVNFQVVATDRPGGTVLDISAKSI